MPAEPEALRISFASPEVRTNPYPLLHRLREEVEGRVKRDGRMD